jgi:hypothetical protein
LPNRSAVHFFDIRVNDVDGPILWTHIAAPENILHLSGIEGTQDPRVTSRPIALLDGVIDWNESLVFGQQIPPAHFFVGGGTAMRHNSQTQRGNPDRQSAQFHLVDHLDHDCRLKDVAGC